MVIIIAAPSFRTGQCAKLCGKWVYQKHAGWQWSNWIFASLSALDRIVPKRFSIVGHTYLERSHSGQIWELGANEPADYQVCKKFNNVFMCTHYVLKMLDYINYPNFHCLIRVFSTVRQFPKLANGMTSGVATSGNLFVQVCPVSYANLVKLKDIWSVICQ